MPTSIPTLNPGDTILDTHIENIYTPINNLETGVAYYGAASGSTNAYTVTLSPVPASYTSGMMVHMLAYAANTGAATINVNGLGAKAIRKEGSVALAGGEIAASQLVTLLYDGANFQLINPRSSISTYTQSLLTLNSGVGLTLTSGNLTLSSGHISTQQSGITSLRRAQSGNNVLLDLINNQATGAVNDTAAMRFYCSDDAGTTNVVQAAQIQGVCADPTAASFDGALVFLATAAGSAAARMRVNDSSSVNMTPPLGVGLASLTTAPSAQMHVRQGTAGSEVLRVETVTSGDDPALKVSQNRTTTTNATPATLHTVAITSGRTYQIEARVQARRTGGSAGTAEDGASYVVRGTYKTVSSTVTLIGSVSADYTAEDQAGWDATLVISGSNVIVQVTGATNNNITWHATVLVSDLAS